MYFHRNIIRSKKHKTLEGNKRVSCYAGWIPILAKKSNIQITLWKYSTKLDIKSGLKRLTKSCIGRSCWALEWWNSGKKHKNQEYACSPGGSNIMKEPDLQPQRPNVTDSLLCDVFCFINKLLSSKIPYFLQPPSPWILKSFCVNKPLSSEEGIKSL